MQETSHTAAVKKFGPDHHSKTSVLVGDLSRTGSWVPNAYADNHGRGNNFHTLSGNS